MKLIIAGSRDLNLPASCIKQLMDFYLLFPTEIVSGGARGIDHCGEQVYRFHKNNGIHRPPIDTLRIFKAKWDDLTHPEGLIKVGKNNKRYDALAGHRRNLEMANYADRLLLIWDGESTGSKNMKETMQELNKPVYEVILPKRLKG